MSVVAATCPMCGARIDQHVRQCAYCGATLIFVQGFNSGDFKASDINELPVLRKLALDNPNDGDAQYRLGLGYLQYELFDPSIEQLRKAANLLPEVPIVHYNLAQAIFANQMVEIGSSLWQEMEAHTSYALRLDPQLAEARAFHHFFIARKLDGRDNQAAIREYGEAINACPDIALFYNNIGLAFYNVGNYKWSERAYEDALKRNQHDALTYSNYCLLCYQLKQYQKGAELGQKGVALLAKGNLLPANIAFVYNNYSLCLWKLGRNREAIDMVQRAIAHNNLQLFHNNLHEYQKKRGWFSR